MSLGNRQKCQQTTHKTKKSWNERVIRSAYFAWRLVKVMKVNWNEYKPKLLVRVDTYPNIYEQFFLSLKQISKWKSYAKRTDWVCRMRKTYHQYFPVSLKQFVGLAIDMNGNRYALNQINCAHSPRRFFSHRRNCAEKAQENFNYNSIEMITKSEEKTKQLKRGQSAAIRGN